MFARLRRFIRQNTLPIKPEVAWAWKTRLSIIYAFLGWQVIGLTVYAILKEKMGGKTSSEDYAKLLGVKNAHVIRITNTQKSDEYELKIKDEELDEYFREIKEREDANSKVKPSGGFWNRRWVDEASTKSILNPR